jgi:hypothetical protein
MAASVNLMTSRARNGAAADRILRGWSWAIGVTFALLTLLAMWTWVERRELMLEHDALEAAYEPIRRLAGGNRGLRAQAGELVSRDAIVLGLAQDRPIAALLAKVNAAIAAAEGAVYIESLTLSQSAATAAVVPRGGTATLTVVSLLGFDVSRLAKQLDAAPFRDVKVTSSETVASGDVPRKTHVIHCEF